MQFTRRHAVLLGAAALAGGSLAAATLWRKPEPRIFTMADAATSAAPLAGLAENPAPAPPPDARFLDGTGTSRGIADFAGQGLILNLWATWCVPCRKEMPSLEALEKKFGGPNFEVVTVNIDTRDPDKPKAWLKEVGISGLKYYADPNAKTFQDLKSAGRALGMPTTVLIDPQGCEIGTIAGPAEWASDDAVKLIEAALKG